jgi:hypothetical protein
MRMTFADISLLEQRYRSKLDFDGAGGALIDLSFRSSCKAMFTNE